MGFVLRVLFIYPEYPETFWSFSHALHILGRKAAYPPLGLLTIASLLPDSWEKRLVDLNVEHLSVEHLIWADLAFIGAMDIQRKSAIEVLSRCRERGVTTVAGGPLFTSSFEEFGSVDYIHVGEGECTVEPFLQELEEGASRHLYRQDDWSDLRNSPVPSWDLIDMNKYACMSIQYSRGCPYHCEFCDVTFLFGRKVRTKTWEQIRKELDRIYDLGWRGGLFFVDDNFIGNSHRLKEDILPSLIDWMEARGQPFSFCTQASINLSDDEILINLMVRAGFEEVFIGIETPEEESLCEAKKNINQGRNLVEDVKKLNSMGLQVQGGFIVGFDSDGPTIFDRLIDFIQDSSIPTAMVGLLNAPKGTELYNRLKEEGRLFFNMSGDNTDFTMNFKPVMDMELLLKEYRRIVDTIYSPGNYIARVKDFLMTYNRERRTKHTLRWSHLKVFLRSMLHLGIFEKERIHYWKLILWSTFKRPTLFPLAVKLYICGYHFRKVFQI